MLYAFLYYNNEATGGAVEENRYAMAKSPSACHKLVKQGRFGPCCA